MQGGFHSSGGEEVNVGDEGHIAFSGAQLLGDFAECFGGVFVGRGDADDFATRFSEREGLGNSGIDVLRVGRRHRLNADRIIAADGDIADVDDACIAALCLEARGAVIEIGKLLRH